MALEQTNMMQRHAVLAQLQAQNNYAAGIGGALNAGIGRAYQTSGNVSGNVTTSITASSGSNTVYIYGNGNAYEAAAPVVAPAPDEFQWLRKRVDDLCWRGAA